jgi:hypothetical protein
MRALYDSRADALQIHIAEGDYRVDHDEDVGERGSISLWDGEPVALEVLSPGRSLEEDIGAAARRYGLDQEVLLATSRSALAAPDREVEVTVRRRAVA